MTEDGQTLTERVWVALARVRDGGKRWRELINEWHECVKRFGPESGAAKGALLELVRLAWGDQRIYVEASAYSERWSVNSGGRPLRQLSVGVTVEATLVAALEAAP